MRREEPPRLEPCRPRCEEPCRPHCKPPRVQPCRPHCGPPREEPCEESCSPPREKPCGESCGPPREEPRIYLKEETIVIREEPRRAPAGPQYGPQWAPPTSAPYVPPAAAPYVSPLAAVTYVPPTARPLMPRGWAPPVRGWVPPAGPGRWPAAPPASGWVAPAGGGWPVATATGGWPTVPISGGLAAPTAGWPVVPAASGWPVATAGPSAALSPGALVFTASASAAAPAAWGASPLLTGLRDGSAISKGDRHEHRGGCSRCHRSPCECDVPPREPPRETCSRCRRSPCECKTPPREPPREVCSRCHSSPCECKAPPREPPREVCSRCHSSPCECKASPHEEECSHCHSSPCECHKCHKVKKWVRVRAAIECDYIRVVYEFHVDHKEYEEETFLLTDFVLKLAQNAWEALRDFDHENRVGMLKGVLLEPCGGWCEPISDAEVFTAFLVWLYGYVGFINATQWRWIRSPIRFPDFEPGPRSDYMLSRKYLKRADEAISEEYPCLPCFEQTWAVVALGGGWSNYIWYS